MVKVSVYQIPLNEQTKVVIFAGWDDLKTFKQSFKPELYEKKFTCNMSEEKASYPEQIYMEMQDMSKFTDTFATRTRSLSVSDIVVIETGHNEKKALFVDTFGFKKVPQFLDYLKKIQNHKTSLKVQPRNIPSPERGR
jgi:hypothetical protein